MRSIRIRRPIAVVAVAATIALAATGCRASDTVVPSSFIDASVAPTVGISSNLAAFETRLRDATAREGQLVRSAAAASGGSRSELRLAVVQMRRWVSDERAWLAEHPPEPCYAAAVTKFDAALDEMNAAVDGLAGIADASVAPSDDVSIPSAGTAAAHALQNATRGLFDSAVLAKTARPDCR